MSRFVALTAWLAATQLAAPAAGVTAGFEQHACLYDKLPAFCGTLRVPEDRSNPGGRTIVLHFVRVPAVRTNGAPVAILDGGPGQSAISDMSQGIREDPLYGPLHASHELLLLDQRGTGLSHELQCRMYAKPGDVFAEIYPLDAVRRCRERLAKTSDLNAYGTDAAADDLDALRQALGYGKVIAIGGSYGTIAALVYLRRHEAAVQSELLISVAPTFFKIPLPQLQAAQRALDALIRSCARDTACHEHFPAFATEFASLLQQSTGGISVNYRNGQTGERVRAKLMRPVFANGVRLLLYAPDTAAWLPLLVHDAARGDPVPLAKVIAFMSEVVNGGNPGGQAMGDNIGVDCQEGVAFITPQEATQESQDTFMAGTILDARRDTCSIWNVRAAESNFIEPVRSSVPVLMMSGAADPATDPRYATRQLAYLPNGRQILIPNGGHSNDNPCLTKIELRFVQTSSVTGLDASCAKGFKRPSFATSLSQIPSQLLR
ncbi:MAG: alpha/beta fold hydrolase [Candidatus Tumulicola sp.]